MGYIFFPFTPTLSLGERENRAPSPGHTRDGVCQASVLKTRGWRRLSPLPEGEGQGEGQRRFDSHRVSPIQGAPQWLAGSSVHPTPNREARTPTQRDGR